MSAVRDPKTDQQLPTIKENSVSVFDHALNHFHEPLTGALFYARLLLEDECKNSSTTPEDLLKQRQELGISKYGQSLYTNDGRDTNREILEEAADLYIYMLKRHLEGHD
jgi:hypothetical protein